MGERYTTIPLLLRGGGPVDDVSQPSRYFQLHPLWPKLAYAVKLLLGGVWTKLQWAATVKMGLLGTLGVMFSGLFSDLLHLAKSCLVVSFQTSCCKTKTSTICRAAKPFLLFSIDGNKKFLGISMCTCLQLQFPSCSGSDRISNSRVRSGKKEVTSSFPSASSLHLVLGK